MNKNAFLAIGLVLAAILVVGGFAAFKNNAVKRTPAPKVVVEENTSEQDVVDEEPPAEKPKKTVKNTSPEVVEQTIEHSERENPELPTEEEAIGAAHEFLDQYRNASPEEKQQMAMGIMMMQMILNSASQAPEFYLQQVPPEVRERIANLAADSQNLLYAVQDEMSYQENDEGVRLLSGLLQSFQNASQAFSDPNPMPYNQQQF